MLHPSGGAGNSLRDREWAWQGNTPGERWDICCEGFPGLLAWGGEKKKDRRKGNWNAESSWRRCQPSSARSSMSFGNFRVRRWTGQPEMVTDVVSPSNGQRCSDGRGKSTHGVVARKKKLLYAPERLLMQHSPAGCVWRWLWKVSLSIFRAVCSVVLQEQVCRQSHIANNDPRDSSHSCLQLHFPKERRRYTKKGKGIMDVQLLKDLCDSREQWGPENSTKWVGFCTGFSVFRFFLCKS